MFLAEEHVPGAGHQEATSGRICRLHCPSPLSPVPAQKSPSTPGKWGGLHSGAWGLGGGPQNRFVCQTPDVRQPCSALQKPGVCEEQEEERELPKERTRVRDPGEAELRSQSHQEELVQRACGRRVSCCLQLEQMLPNVRSDQLVSRGRRAGVRSTSPISSKDG